MDITETHKNHKLKLSFSSAKLRHGEIQISSIGMKGWTVVDFPRVFLDSFFEVSKYQHSIPKE